MQVLDFLVVLSLTVGVHSTTIYSSYRKDYFYPYEEYREVNLPDPVNGGRFHLVSQAEGNGTVASITINGKKVTFDSGQDPDSWYMDWLHVYPSSLQEGEPLWVSFHTRDKSFNNQPSQASIQLTSSSGQSILKGNFLVQLSDCNITYITTTTNYSTLLVHVHNGYADNSRTIKTVFVNGTDVTTRVANSASLSIAPKTSTLLSIPLSSSQAPGYLVTVALLFAENDAVPIANGVRLAKTHFPIESWPKSHECPFPTVMDANYKFHRDHGIDTLYFGQGAAKPCGKSITGSDIAGKLAPQYNFYCLIDSDIPVGSIANSSNVLGRLLGDEADSHLDDQLRNLMTVTDKLWQKEQGILTYVGGSRSRRNGIFSGVTDIQGMDMYVAACAPHIQEFLHPPPLRGSYDYLRLTRNNHMPLPTWTYSQLLDDGWDAKIGDHVISHRQPNPDEARIQAMSVIAACAKGLMYFQSDISEQDHYPQTWVEIGNFNKDIGAVREYLRQGDCTDMVVTSDGSNSHSHSVAQAIRSPNAIIVPVINLKNDGGISDPGCAIGENLHWKIDDHTVSSIVITITSDFGSVLDTFEVRNGAIYNVSDFSISYSTKVLGVSYYGNKLIGGSVSLSNVALSSSMSTRLFVLANTAEVRGNIQNNLKASWREI